MTSTARQDRRVSTKTTVEHPSVAERVARGQAVGSDVPRSAYADLDPGPDRADPVARLDRALRGIFRARACAVSQIRGGEGRWLS